VLIHRSVAEEDWKDHLIDADFGTRVSSQRFRIRNHYKQLRQVSPALTHGNGYRRAEGAEGCGCWDHRSSLSTIIYDRRIIKGNTHISETRLLLPVAGSRGQSSS